MSASGGAGTPPRCFHTFACARRTGLCTLQQVALILTHAHHACTIGRVDFSAEPSVCFMRYGSITLKSAVGSELSRLLGSDPSLCPTPITRESGQLAYKDTPFGVCAPVLLDTTI